MFTMTSRLQPEQDGPANRTWSNIVENNKQETNRPPVFSPQDDFIPLDGERSNDDLFNRSTGKDGKQLKRKLPANEKPYTNGYITSNSSWTNNESEYLSPPWKTKDYSQDAIGLNDEIHDFLSYIKPRPEEDAIRRNVVDRVEAVIKELWPKAEVEIYGSCQTGLYLPTSDIDLVVHGKWQSLPLRTLENALLEKEIADANSIRVLDKASVPIIKVTDKKTEVKFDISFNMKTGVQSADMIKNYIKQYPALPYLTFVLKQYLLNRDLNEVFCGGISSYTVVLMIVSYFQHSEHFNFSESEANLGVLLIEFFELYGKKFNYNNVGIRLVDGGSYFNKDKVLGDLASSMFLCIEDPLTKGNFIGQNSFRIHEVKKAFELTCKLLANAVLNHIPGNESCSILARILRVPKETMEQRERTLKLFFQTSSVPTMPSYASVATRNTQTTTIRSIDGVKTIDLVTRSEPPKTYATASTSQAFTTNQNSDNPKMNDERSRMDHGRVSPSRHSSSYERTRHHAKDNNDTNRGISRNRRDRLSFKDQSSTKRNRNRSTERTSHRDKVHEKQQRTSNHEPTSPKRSQVRSPPSSPSITETCAMHSTKGVSSIKEIRSQTERLYC